MPRASTGPSRATRRLLSLHSRIMPCDIQVPLNLSLVVPVQLRMYRVPQFFIHLEYKLTVSLLAVTLVRNFVVRSGSGNGSRRSERFFKDVSNSACRCEPESSLLNAVDWITAEWHVGVQCASPVEWAKHAAMSASVPQQPCRCSLSRDNMQFVSRNLSIAQ